MIRSDELVRVAAAGNQAIGAMWREVLENNGIPCFLRIAGPLTAYATFASPHDLFVKREDADRAREVLEAYDEDEGDFTRDLDEASDEYWMEGADETDIAEGDRADLGARGDGPGNAGTNGGGGSREG